MRDLAQMLRDRATEHGGDKLLEEAAAALEAAREDAERYRWLRAQNVIAVTSHDQSVEYQRDDLDAEVDQSRGKGVAGEP